MLSDKFLNIASLAESQDSIGPISRDGYAEVVVILAQVSHFKVLVELVFDALDRLFVGSGKQDIVYIDSNNNGTVTEDGVVGYNRLETKL